MARGRRAAPAQDKVIRGVFRSDRDSHGPQVEIGVPACPKWLPAAAKKYWAELGPEMARSGLLSTLDQGEFARLCECEARYQEVVEKIKGLDDLVDTTPQGYAVVSVWFVVRNKLIEQLDKLNAKFGRSPAARSSIRANPAQGQLSLGGFGDL